MSDTEKFLNSAESGMPLVSKLLYQLIDEKYRILLDESSDLMCITDREGKFIYVNQKLADSLGYTKKEMLSLHMEDIISPESRNFFQEKTREFLKAGKARIEHFVLKTKYDGKIVGELNSRAVYDNAGKFCGAKSVFKDHTKFLAIERLEKKYESMLEDGINMIDSVIFILDKEFRIRWATTSAHKYFGFDKIEIIGEDLRQIFKDKAGAFIQDSDTFFKNVFYAYEENRCVESFEFEIAPMAGRQNYIMEYWSYPITQGDLSGGRIEIFRDITARKKAEETLEYYYKKIHAIMEHAVEGIVELRMDNSVEFANKSFQEMVGHSDIEILNKSFLDFIHPDERSRLASIKLIRKAREITFVRKDGTWLYVLMSSIPLVFGTHSPHVLLFISDITEGKTAAYKLRDANLTLRALNDSLLDLSLRDVRTGLYNARYMHERLTEELKRAKRFLRPFSLIMIDIDFFKSINDSFGHLFGDVILKDFTELIKKTVRETDIVVRSGGEEFMILLSDTNSPGALTVAQKIAKALKITALGDAQRRIRVTVSMGVVSYPETGDADMTGLLNAVDQAMYQSKHNGRNRITVFSKVSRSSENEKVLTQGSSLEGFRERLKNISLRNEESILESLMPLVRQAHQRIGYPADHIDLVLKEIERLAVSFSMSEKEILNLKRAALLRDLGFLNVSSDLLMKDENNPLSKEDLQSIREHPLHSLEMIRDVSFLSPLSRDILYHHERYDGQGYPEGLKGEDIPLSTKIISVVDAFEALTSVRPYRPKPLSRQQAFEVIRSEAGKQFDPVVVEHFLNQTLQIR